MKPQDSNFPEEIPPIPPPRDRRQPGADQGAADAMANQMGDQMGDQTGDELPLFIKRQPNGLVFQLCE
jgi:hypothetical protein